MLRRGLVVCICELVFPLTYEATGTQPPVVGHTTRPTLAPAPVAPVTDPVTQAGRIVNVRPALLLIPSIGLNATIEARGLDANRNMATAKSYQNVAWYDLGPAPGQPGNALINGHVNWWTGNAVFTNLSRVRAGDQVEVIRADGTVVRFRISVKQTVDANARIASLFAPSTVSTLTLITCTGVWNPLTLSDTQRLLVSAVLA